MAGKKFIKLFLFNVMPDNNELLTDQIDEQIDWSKPKKLVDVKDLDYSAVDRFFCWTLDWKDFQKTHALKKERDLYDIVILPFDLEDNGMQRCWGKWMQNEDYESSAIFDFRTMTKKELWREFGIRSYFKKNLDLVDDRPRLVASEEIKNDPTDEGFALKTNAALYPLDLQKLMMYTVSYGNKTHYMFHKLTYPYSFVEEFTIINKELLNNRAMLIKDC